MGHDFFGGPLGSPLSRKSAGVVSIELQINSNLQHLMISKYKMGDRRVNKIG